MKSFIFVLVTLVSIQSINIPITIGEKRCMATFSAYEPMKLETIFPEIPEKQPDEFFRLTISSTQNKSQFTQHIIQSGETFRKELMLKQNVIYEICFELISERYSLPNNQDVKISYKITEDLSRLIGTIEIPTDLAHQKKLADLYVYAEEISRMNKKVIEFQEKQRKLEDEISSDNVHKNFRIISLTLIECGVIVISGIYQVFALRKFLIDKNLY